jgi:hypothetical protein
MPLLQMLDARPEALRKNTMKFLISNQLLFYSDA